MGEAPTTSTATTKPKKKWPFALIAVAVVALLCVCAIPFLAPLACFVPLPRTVTLVPAARFEVTGAQNGGAIAGARIVLERGSDPHGRPGGRWVERANTLGRFAFERTTADETIMPLMMHGVPFYYWNACVDAPGRAARRTERARRL